MGYRKWSGEFRSSNGRQQIAYYVYEPEDTPVRAVVQLAHGMTEHVEWYESLAEDFCKNGIAFCGNDHLGHGKNAQAAGMLGFFDHKDGWKYLSQDQRKMTLLMKERFPGVPYVLLGYSMGSFIARDYFTHSSDLLDGAVLLGTSAGNPFCGAGVFLAGLVIRKNGELYRSKLLHQLSLGQYNTRFKAENCEISWLTRNESVREKYLTDPLCHFRFTASGYRDLFALLRAISSKEWLARVPKDLPILIASGTDDPVGDFGKGVTRFFHQLQELGVSKAELRLYENDRHEIFHEPDAETVRRDILQFVEHIEKETV